MSRLMVSALHVGIAAALAMGISACNRDASADAGLANGASSAEAGAPGAKYARVVSVDPVRKTVNNPRQTCHDEVVTNSEPPKDQHQIAGTAIGAIAGGLLGNQVGGGKGRTLATVAGAVAGGYAGKKIQENRQHANVTTSTERKCESVNDSGSKVVGYDVRYEYNGVTRTVRMDHDPGDRVQVQEGVVAVSDAH
ncbi:glycine zipper 2TM domain-containing protein [Frateuria sp.]|uniref:glycine zipper 2TM domain-containing protein n=1 Tax=Frateuria sp. TaxID=2211372 RepID=UPI0018156360|nr:glycine zipper 2TM domain-containing protein [Frateuria sp.]NUR23462.1 glycine zipper 2TM domain-containing protein [Frateuria sp.]